MFRAEVIDKIRTHIFYTITSFFPNILQFMR